MTYGNGDGIVNVSLECADCDKVLLDFDNNKIIKDFYEIENIEWDLSEFTEKQKKSYLSS